MKKLNSKLPINNISITNKELLDYFDDSWRLSDILYNSVKLDSLYNNPDKLRYPLIFYLGHVVVFYINVLIKASILTQRINEDFEKLFAVGVDPSSSKELHAQINWPPLSEVKSYREKAYKIIYNTIEKADVTKVLGYFNGY